MSVTIRLSLSGKKGQSKYRIVICEKRSKRDGRYTDLIGDYDPGVKPPVLRINQKKFADWQQKGAIASPKLLKIIKTSLNEKVN